MKSITTKLMIAAAALAVATGALSAQAMKADIPFAFRAGDRVMEPGSYRVDVKSANSLVFLSNIETKGTSMLLGTAGTAANEWRAKGAPILAFECGAGRCSLTRLWTGSENAAYTIPHRKLAGGEQASVTLIRLVRANGD